MAMSMSLCERVWRSRNRSIAQPPQNAQGRGYSAMSDATAWRSWRMAKLLYRLAGGRHTDAEAVRMRGQDRSGTIRHMSANGSNDLVQDLTRVAKRPDVRAILFDLDDTL